MQVAAAIGMYIVRPWRWYLHHSALAGSATKAVMLVDASSLQCDFWFYQRSEKTVE